MEQFATRCHIGDFTPVVPQPAENSPVNQVLSADVVVSIITDSTVLLIFL